jgi:hypothetical protein
VPEEAAQKQKSKIKSKIAKSRFEVGASRIRFGRGASAAVHRPHFVRDSGGPGELPKPSAVAPLAQSSGRADGGSSGFLGGGQVGFNYQIYPQWVLGVEADIAGTTIKDSVNASFLFSSAPGFPPHSRRPVLA